MANVFKQRSTLEKLLEASFEESLKLAIQFFPNLKDKDFEKKTDALRAMVLNAILDWPTQANVVDWLSVSLRDIENTLNHSVKYGNVKKVQPAALVIPGQCHASTTLNWVLNPKLEIHSGFSDKTHFHSWLYDPETGVIYEPTDVIRASYRGFKQDEVHFALEEIYGVENVKDIAPEAYAKYQEFLKSR